MANEEEEEAQTHWNIFVVHCNGRATQTPTHRYKCLLWPLARLNADLNMPLLLSHSGRGGGRRWECGLWGWISFLFFLAWMFLCNNPRSLKLPSCQVTCGKKPQTPLASIVSPRWTSSLKVHSQQLHICSFTLAALVCSVIRVKIKVVC